MGEYIPQAGKGSAGLSGMGGVYNTINMHTYAYTHNNPIKLIDPDGRRPRIPADWVWGVRGWRKYDTKPSPKPQVAPGQRNTPLASISGRTSMVEAFGTNDGPCMFRALLGIAETRAGRALSQSELDTARERYFGSTNNNSWGVRTRRSDGKGDSMGTALGDVINIGLELLGSEERAIYIEQVKSINNLPEDTQATIIGVNANSSTGSHFLEGDAMGNMTFDPLDNIDNYRNLAVERIDAFRFDTPQRPENL